MTALYPFYISFNRVCFSYSLSFFRERVGMRPPLLLFALYMTFNSLCIYYIFPVNPCKSHVKKWPTFFKKFFNRDFPNYTEFNLSKLPSFSQSNQFSNPIQQKNRYSLFASQIIENIGFWFYAKNRICFFSIFFDLSLK